MQNSEHYRGGSRAPGAKVKEFFSWLKGLWSPKYIPQRSQFEDRGKKKATPKSDLGARPEDE